MIGKNDVEGRAVVILHDVRGAINTAAASLTTGTATTLIAGDADYFTDIIEMTFANNSGAAQVLIKCDGTVMRTVQVPGNTTLQLDFEAPLEQPVKGQPILVDLEDITGSQIDVGATWMKKAQ